MLRVRVSGRARAIAAAALVASAACAPRPASPLADTIVYGRVWTGDSTALWAEAVAIAGDTIMAVGDSAGVAPYVGAGTQLLRHDGALVLPGFMDSHTHFLSGGFQLASVDLRAAATPEEFVARIRDYAKTLQPGEWILGGDWDHERWPGTPLPERGWIDSVTPNNPVFVNRLDGHMALANGLALQLAGMGATTADIPGGTIVRDAAGAPTGLLKDEAMGPVFTAVPTPSDAQMDSALTRAMAWAASKGVTSVSAVSLGWHEVAALRRAHQRGTLTTRVAVYVPLADWRRTADTVRVRGPGDDRLRVAGVKGFVDGSLGSTTALFDEPYADEPYTRGLLTTPVDSLRAWIGAADSAGLQVVVHAIGDSANGMLLDIYDSVAQAHGPRDRRFRIEHAQHLRRDDIARMARLDVIASMQPYHAIDDGRWAEKRIGPERIRTTYAFRSLLDAGAHLAFGSDWTVAPLDPILGIHAAVTRRTLDGAHPGGWVPEEKITLQEALRAYTVENAYAMFADTTRGMLRPGYKADLVILDRDLTTLPEDQLETAGVRQTIVGGKVVFPPR